MKSFFFSPLLLVISLFLFSSCQKEEGEGGTSTVQGYVFKVIHQDETYGFRVDTVPAAKEDVFIKYGGGPIYDDDMETGPDGFFRFKYLQKGTYTVFAYTKYPDDMMEDVSKEVKVGAGNTVTVDPIYIHSGKMLGRATIQGRLMVRYFYKGVLIGTGPGIDERVTLQLKGSPLVVMDARAGADGTFVFPKVPVGEYEVYAVTEAIDTEIVTTISFEVNVTPANLEVVMPEDIIVSKNTKIN
ncbi:MAG: hypothetical protein AB7C90_04475 [Bacteroidales bacterium]